MKIRLTDLAVKKLPLASEGQVTYWDALTPNFGIRCSARSKSYVVLIGDKRRRKTIGRYPSVSLSDARKHARKLLAAAELTGQSLERHEYDTVVQAYLEECTSRLRQSSMYGYRLYLNGITFSGPIDEVTQDQIMRKMRAFTSSPSSQNYAFRTLKGFFNWAVRRQFVSANPLAALKRPHQPITRERVLSDDELVTVLSYCQATNDRFTQVVELLAYTGQRKSEIANLEWQEVSDKCIVLPPSRTKNKREHLVPLCDQAFALLHEIEGGVRYVFGSPIADVPFNGFGKSTKRLLTETGVAHFTLHDLRRTFATNHARIGTPVHVAEKLLNHVSGTISGVAAIYNRHSYQAEMSDAMANYSTFLNDLGFAAVAHNGQQ